MANSSKPAPDILSSWSIDLCHNYLSFSSDGTTLAGTVAPDTAGYTNGKIQFWDTHTGAITSTFNDYSYIVFSPTDPDTAVGIGSGGIRPIKRDPQGRIWNEMPGGHTSYLPPSKAIFRSDGTRVTTTYTDQCLREYTTDEPFQFGPNPMRYTDTVRSRPLAVVYCPFEPDSLLVGRENGEIAIITYTSKFATSNVRFQFSSVGAADISAAAWSPDGRWIATGDNSGEVRLWNGNVTTNISLSTILPPLQSQHPVDSLIFIPDSSGLIVLSGGRLSLWNIEKATYVKDCGLPTTAKSIAMDGPRNRVAVVSKSEDKVSLYNIQVPVPQKKNRGRGKPSLPAALVALDITGQVVKSEPDVFEGLYLDIYRGAWKLDTPRVFQHVVAIKVLRPGFSSLTKATERKEFQDLITKRLITWSTLFHDNLVTLLGISMDFGNFPAMITSWMIHGFLSDYLMSDEIYDEMELVIGVASGVAYLHKNGIIHGDIRASSFVVDELRTVRLADPGLLPIFADSPLVKNGNMKIPYRWMAPELLLHSSPKLTYATDTYSVTMTSLEIFTGSPPFKDVNDAMVTGQIMQGIRPDRPSNVESGLWSLWIRGWDDDPAHRPFMDSYVAHLKRLY